MLLGIKILLLLFNLLIAIFLFFTKNYSLGIFFIFLFVYQIYVYITIKNFDNATYFTKRVKIGTMVLNFVVMAIVARLVNVQIINGNYYEKIARDQVSSSITRAGKRGDIYDINMKKLAFNDYVYNVILDPTRVSGNEAVFEVLGKLNAKKILNLNLSKLNTELEELSNAGNRYKVIERKISETDKKIVEEILKESKLKNNEIFFEKIIERKYYKNKNYGNLVGNIGYPPNQAGYQKIGVFGVEKYYENYLKEKIIKIKAYFTKKRDIKLPTSQDILEKPLDGKNVILTIDDEIGYILNTEVEKQFINTEAAEAYALIMNPNNGKIIATSYFSKMKKDLRNPIFQDQFEPGSTFKPLIISAAIEENYISHDSKFNVGNGTILKFGHTIKESSRSTQGIISTEEILKKSSNVGMVLVGDKFSDEKFEEYLRKFGFYDKTGVDFPNELRPYASSYKKWDKLKKSTMSFGQGIVVTPIQLATAFSAVVNGGILYRPYMVDRIEDQDGTVIRRNLPKEVRRIISKKTSDELKVMLENTVESGGGKKAMVNGYKVGGKTGTAQLSAPGGGYLKNEYLSSFIGFFPVEKPEYVVLIMMLKPQGKTVSDRYGGSVSAPVFGEVVSKITQNKNMMSQDIMQINNVEQKSNSNIKITKNNEEQNLENEVMPNLKGMNAREVLALFKDRKFKIEMNGKGVVKDQKPLPGESLDEVDYIKIDLVIGEVKK